MRATRTVVYTPPPVPVLTVGARMLLAWREREGLSQYEAGKLCRLDMVQWYEYECGLRVPLREIRERISLATGGVVAPEMFEQP